jgi:hypothetical protein
LVQCESHRSSLPFTFEPGSKFKAASEHDFLHRVMGDTLRFTRASNRSTRSGKFFINSSAVVRDYVSLQNPDLKVVSSASSGLQAGKKYPLNDRRFWETLFGDLDETQLGPQEPFCGKPCLVDSEPMNIMGTEEHEWCVLCGFGEGWSQCAGCEGSGSFHTKPGLAGVSKMVGKARCKICYGRGVIPCGLCGIPEEKEWLKWQQHARRWPKRNPPRNKNKSTESS